MVNAFRWMMTKPPTPAAKQAARGDRQGEVVPWTNEGVSLRERGYIYRKDSLHMGTVSNENQNR